MGVHRCRTCDTVVLRAQLCARCGKPQPWRLLRLAALIGTGVVATAFVVTFLSIEGGGPPFEAPRPSAGQWISEEDMPDLWIGTRPSSNPAPGEQTTGNAGTGSKL